MATAAALVGSWAIVGTQIVTVPQEAAAGTKPLPCNDGRFACRCLRGRRCNY